MTELSDLIDTLLRERRPARYTPTDAPWLDELAAEIEPLIPDDTRHRLVTIHARGLVGNRDTAAVKVVHRLFRVIGQTHQLPLFWSDIGREPFSVDGEHIRLDDASPADAELFDRHERKRITAEFDRRLAAVDGAGYLAEQARDIGAARIWDALSVMTVFDGPTEPDDDADDGA